MIAIVLIQPNKNIVLISRNRIRKNRCSGSIHADIDRIGYRCDIDPQCTGFITINVNMKFRQIIVAADLNVSCPRNRTHHQCNFSCQRTAGLQIESSNFNIDRSGRSEIEKIAQNSSRIDKGLDTGDAGELPPQVGRYIKNGSIACFRRNKSHLNIAGMTSGIAASNSAGRLRICRNADIRYHHLCFRNRRKNDFFQTARNRIRSLVPGTYRQFVIDGKPAFVLIGKKFRPDKENQPER